MSILEIAANAVTAASILLAARNSVHTWWLGLIGCGLFAAVFASSQLYADATLQGFFIVTSAIGWWQWTHGHRPGAARPVSRARPRTLLWMSLAAVAVTAGYGSLLHRYTDAFMPFVDSAVLAGSVIAQCLLMQRRIDTWPAWLLVNTLSVPLFAARGLHLTAVLYALYWLNAWHGWWVWRGAHRAARPAAA